MAGPRRDQARRSTWGVVETETPEVGDGETTGNLEAKLGGPPVATPAFSELKGYSAMGSRVYM